MKAVEDMLPQDRFLRIHRSYISKEIIHIPDGYLPTFRQFLETRSMEKR
ncbi:LytTR family transcriptional regulator [Prevotella sp. khp7]|nr:LytTR family transcriptional regulator [Prevotella sp. khp7]